MRLMKYLALPKEMTPFEQRYLVRLNKIALMMGVLLVRLGQGPVQIEMHFYFFALLAMLCMFANPLVNLAAAVTVALHHLIVWLIVPRSVFNYEAEWCV